MRAKAFYGESAAHDHRPTETVARARCPLSPGRLQWPSMFGPLTPLGCLSRLLGFLGTLFLLAVIAVVVLVFLAFSGSPGGCGKDGPAGVDETAAASFDNKLLLLNAALAYGQGGEFSLDEREATARARLFLEQNHAPVEGLTICFRPGIAVGKAHIDTPVLGGVDVTLKGTVALDGGHPRVMVEDVQVGALPSFFTDPFKGLVNRIADDQTDRIPLFYRYSLRFDQGTATLSGAAPAAAGP